MSTAEASAPLLFTPLTFRGVTFPNRLWVSPMCMYSAVDGVVTDWHRVHVPQFASGGAGLVMVEATAVSPEGRISPQDAGIWNDEQRDAWAEVVQSVHTRGGVAAIQLAHAGRKASTWWPWAGQHGSVPLEEGGWVTVAPSPIAFEGYALPVSLDADGLAKVVADFRAAARRSLDAGFDVLEVHGAHGYLLHEFLSPLSNERTDEYGGSLENRARLLLEVLDAVRDEAGADVPVFVRISATDFAEGGFHADEAVIVSGWLRDHGADLVDVSTAALVKHQQLEVYPGYQVPFADRIRREASVPTSAVGLITSGAQAEQILQDGSADAIFIGREWLRDPHFGLRAAHELGVDVPWPQQYARGRWH